jgi:hypothetical protein
MSAHGRRRALPRPIPYRAFMGSTIDQSSSNVSTSKADTAKVLGYFGTAGTIISAAVTVYEFLQKGSSQ